MWRLCINACVSQTEVRRMSIFWFCCHGDHHRTPMISRACIRQRERIFQLSSAAFRACVMAVAFNAVMTAAVHPCGQVDGYFSAKPFNKNKQKWEAFSIEWHLFRHFQPVWATKANTGFHTKKKSIHAEPDLWHPLHLTTLISVNCPLHMIEMADISFWNSKLFLSIVTVELKVSTKRNHYTVLKML